MKACWCWSVNRSSKYLFTFVSFIEKRNPSRLKMNRCFIRLQRHQNRFLFVFKVFNGGLSFNVCEWICKICDISWLYIISKEMDKTYKTKMYAYEFVVLYITCIICWKDGLVFIITLRLQFIKSSNTFISPNINKSIEF